MPGVGGKVNSLFPGNELIGEFMKHYKKTITTMLIAPVESDEFGIYVKWDSAGCEDVEITWGSDPVEAIMQATGLRK